MTADCGHALAGKTSILIHPHAGKTAILIHHHRPALAVPDVLPLTLTAPCPPHVHPASQIYTVSERWIALAMLRLLEHEKSVVEGGGATGYAALLANKIPGLEGKKVVFPLCGGNVDMAMLGRVIDRGLAADARLIQFTATVSDRPGGIASLTSILAQEGVSIRDIFHERAWVYANTYQVRVKVVAETSGADHAGRMFRRLEATPGITMEVDSSKWHFVKDLPPSEQPGEAKAPTEGGNLLSEETIDEQHAAEEAHSAEEAAITEPRA